MFDQVTLKLSVDPLILSALKEDVTSEDVTTNSVMPKGTLGEVDFNLQGRWHYLRITGFCQSFPAFR